MTDTIIQRIEAAEGADRALMESVVHGLRMQGWSRIDAEDEALERIERRRAALRAKDHPNG